MERRKRLQDLSVDEFMACSFSSNDDNDSFQEDISAVAFPKRKMEKRKLKTKNKIPRKSNNEDDEHISDGPMPFKKGKKRKSKIRHDLPGKRMKNGKSNDIVEIESTQVIDISDSDSENVAALETNSKVVELSDETGSDSENEAVLEKNSKVVEVSDGTDSEYSDTNEKGLQKAMGKLKEKDPEFFKFLEENDKDLLEFAASDEENDDQQKELDESDGESFDKAADDGEETKVNRKLIEKWSVILQEKPDLATLRKVISAFKAAVQEASGDTVESSNGYCAVGSIEFNAVVQLCMEHFVPSLHKLLKLPEPSTSNSDHYFNASKLRGWKKVCSIVKSYLGDVITLLTVVSKPAVVSALLKHILYLVPFYLAFVKMSRSLLKTVISFWCTGEEAVRVLSFLCIIRLVRSLPSEYLDYVLKQMYLSYVKNCKFTSPSIWPLINFMKRSLVELYSLNESIAYQHAFTYIRQLSIHLRNAVTVKKKDAFHAVYNWQYIHCLLLWIHLLSTLHQSTILRPLIYPLTQTTIGTIKLIPTSKYIPLRFHLVRGLTQLSSETDTFIPVLPLIFEPLDIVDFHKKHTGVSLKPLDFSCALKLSKSQLQENVFKDTVIENMYDLLLEYLETQANRIAFPELVLPTVVHIKSFIKKCKISNYCRKLKQLVDKIQENANMISERRKSVGFQLSDCESVKKWEEETKSQGTPLKIFYKSWKKVHKPPPESKEIEAT